VIARPGGFSFLVIGPHKPAPGPFDFRLRLGKYFRLRDGIGPHTPALGLCGYHSGWIGLRASHICNGLRGFFVFDIRRPFVVARDEAGKMPALLVAKHNQRNGIFGLR